MFLLYRIAVNMKSKNSYHYWPQEQDLEPIQVEREKEWEKF